MGSSGGGCGWSVFDCVKPPLPSNPDALMAEIDAAITTAEYSRAAPAAAEDRPPYDVRLADEAYKSACAAMAAGRPDAAVRSLRVALASCPPDRKSALSKLRSLLSIASSQQSSRPL